MWILLILCTNAQMPNPRSMLYIWPCLYFLIFFVLICHAPGIEIECASYVLEAGFWFLVWSKKKKKIALALVLTLWPVTRWPKNKRWPQTPTTQLNLKPTGGYAPTLCCRSSVVGCRLVPSKSSMIAKKFCLPRLTVPLLWLYSALRVRCLPCAMQLASAYYILLWLWIYIYIYTYA